MLHCAIQMFFYNIAFFPHFLGKTAKYMKLSVMAKKCWSIPSFQENIYEKNQNYYSSFHFIYTDFTATSLCTSTTVFFCFLFFLQCCRQHFFLTFNVKENHPTVPRSMNLSFQLFLFLSTRQKIEERLQCVGEMLVWTFAPGYLINSHKSNLNADRTAPPPPHSPGNRKKLLGAWLSAKEWA